MSAITEAVEAVNQQARAFKAVQLIADVVRQIGDLESRLAKLTDQVADKAATRDTLDQEIKNVSAQIARLRDERDQAGVKALEQARVDAQAIVDRAKSEAAAAIANANDEVAAANAVLDARGKELKETNAAIDAAKAQLAEVEAKLATAKEAVRKMLGGE